MPHQSRWPIDVPHISIPSYVFSTTTQQPSSKLFIDTKDPETRYLTANSLREWAKRLAAGLQLAGLVQGDRIMLFSGNSLFTPVVLFGTLMAGGVLSSANPAFTERELAHQLKDSTPRFILAARDQWELAIRGAAMAGLPASSVFAFHSLPVESFASPEIGPTSLDLPPKAVSWTKLLAPVLVGKSFEWESLATPELSNRTALLFYSSGTTGLPKGVEISHYSIVANMIQIMHMQGLAKELASNVSERASLCALPMYHGLGLVYYALIAPRAGLPVYLMERFHLVDYLAAIERFRITDLLLVPPIVVWMGKARSVGRYNLSSVQRVVAGAAPLGMEATVLFERLWPAGKVKVRQAWGMSEVPCMLFGWHHETKSATSSTSVGELVPGAQAKIVSENGIEVPDGQRGELWCRAPNVMKGYWRKPSSTRQTLTEDGWVKTGDIAYATEQGYFFIVDRQKELIKVRGAQVAPAELEALLLEHPSVLDAAVVGHRTEDGDEKPKAFIVCQQNSALSEKEVCSFVNDRVSKTKRITGGVVFLDQIPKNPSGKILRRKLRDENIESSTRTLQHPSRL